jgi:hypothetical protein
MRCCLGSCRHHLGSGCLRQTLEGVHRPVTRDIGGSVGAISEVRENGDVRIAGAGAQLWTRCHRTP